MSIKDLEEELDEPEIIKMFCERQSTCPQATNAKGMPITKRIYDYDFGNRKIITYDCEYGACTYIETLHHQDPNIIMKIPDLF